MSNFPQNYSDAQKELEGIVLRASSLSGADLEDLACRWMHIAQQAPPAVDVGNRKLGEGNIGSALRVLNFPSERRIIESLIEIAQKGLEIDKDGLTGAFPVEFSLRIAPETLPGYILGILEALSMPRAGFMTDYTPDEVFTSLRNRACSILGLATTAYFVEGNLEETSRALLALFCLSHQLARTVPGRSRERLGLLGKALGEINKEWQVEREVKEAMPALSKAIRELPDFGGPA